MKKNKGFTFVETVIVVVIICVLLAVSVFGVYKWVQNARMSADKNDLTYIANNIVSVIDSDLYLSEHFQPDLSWKSPSSTKVMGKYNAFAIDFNTYNLNKRKKNGKSLDSWEEMFVSSDSPLQFNSTFYPIPDNFSNMVELENGQTYQQHLDDLGLSVSSSRIIEAYMGYLLDKLKIDIFEARNGGKYGISELIFYKNCYEMGDDPKFYDKNLDQSWGCYYLISTSSLPSTYKVREYLDEHGSLDGYSEYLDSFGHYGKTQIFKLI